MTYSSVTDTAIRVSAVVCTFDRPGALRRSLASLACQSLPRSSFEVIVVDNGPRAFAAALVGEEFPEARYIRESHAGLSRARNAGLREAGGALVAYLDDDAEAAPDWLERIWAAFSCGEPAPGCIGGRVDPVWEAPPPTWLSRELHDCLSLLDLSESRVVLQPGQWIVGCNMAFRRTLLERIGGFRESLGRRGRDLASMEEILALRQVRAAGFECHYDPAVRVRHHIPAERLEKAWFRRRLFWNGVSTARMEAELGRLSSPLGRLRRIASAALSLASPRWLSSLFSRSDDPDRFTRKCRAIGRLGYLAGLVLTFREAET